MWTPCHIWMPPPKINDNECLPWNMPSPDGHACCNPIEQHDFFNTFDNLDMSKVMGAELWDAIQYPANLLSDLLGHFLGDFLGDRSKAHISSHYST